MQGSEGGVRRTLSRQRGLEGLFSRDMTVTGQRDLRRRAKKNTILGVTSNETDESRVKHHSLDVADQPQASMAEISMNMPNVSGIKHMRIRPGQHSRSRLSGKIASEQFQQMSIDRGYQLNRQTSANIVFNGEKLNRRGGDGSMTEQVSYGNAIASQVFRERPPRPEGSAGPRHSKIEGSPKPLYPSESTHRQAVHRRRIYEIANTVNNSKDPHNIDRDSSANIDSTRLVDKSHCREKLKERPSVDRVPQPLYGNSSSNIAAYNTKEADRRFVTSFVNNLSKLNDSDRKRLEQLVSHVCTGKVDMKKVISETQSVEKHPDKVKQQTEPRDHSPTSKLGPLVPLRTESSSAAQRQYSRVEMEPINLSKTRLNFQVEPKDTSPSRILHSNVLEFFALNGWNLK
jgi:hypothetical protein